MRYLIQLTIISFVLLNTLYAKGLEFTHEEREYLKSNKIVLGVDNAYAPMNFINAHKQIDGITIDYIKIIEKYIAKEINLEVAPWVEVLDKAMSHKIDGIVNINKTPQRETKLNFTEPYVLVPFGYITLNKSSSLKNIDQLTKAYNREFFETHIDKIIVEHEKNNKHLGVAILDIDHFKDVNDNFGHNIGDSVLVEFVQRVQKFSRKDDTFIRWGGEEFLLLLPIDTQEDLKKALEHIRRVIELKAFEHVGKITCSIGASIYQKENIYSTIERADQALYQAKESGRNRVVIV